MLSKLNRRAVKSMEQGSAHAEEFYSRLLTNIQESRPQIAKLALWVLLKTLTSNSHREFMKHAKVVERNTVMLLNSHIFRKIDSTSKFIRPPSEVKTYKERKGRASTRSVPGAARSVHKLPGNLRVGD